MRVRSNRQHTLKDGSIGWWHGESDQKFSPLKFKKPDPKPGIDFTPLMVRWWKETPSEFRSKLAHDLGVTTESLVAFRAAWARDRQAWAFPMYDASGKVSGIRLRYMDGRKISEKGSIGGPFIPKITPQFTVWLPEGPTDGAALLSLGLFAIGRPSNNSGGYQIKMNLQRLGVRSAVIVADNDEDKLTPSGVKFNPGYEGARSLARQITIPCCIVSLPAKDCREFVKHGGTAEMLSAIAKSVIWENR